MAGLRDAPALAESLGIADAVDFPGFKLNPLPYMARSAVFVLSSVMEGCSNALVQAMACGTPLVSSDCPGAREILMDGALGRITPVGDHRAMAAAILDTLKNPTDRADLLGGARRYAAETGIDGYLDLIGRCRNDAPRIR